MATEKSQELFRALCENGTPKDLSKEIAYKQMNTDYTATRIIGYLYGRSQLRVEDVVDEMLAIHNPKRQG